MLPPRHPESRLPSGSDPRDRQGEDSGSQNPRPTATPRTGGRRSSAPGRAILSMPVRRPPRVLLLSARGGASQGSAGTGRGGGDTHPWWRWRRQRWGPSSVTSAAGAACRGPGRRGRQRAWLRAGAAGCARGPRRLPRLRLRLRPQPGAVAWAGWPATSPALPGSAQPGLGGAARPARPPVPQSRSRSVGPPFSTSGTLRKTNRWLRSSPPSLSLTPALTNRRQSLDIHTTPTHFSSQ